MKVSRKDTMENDEEVSTVISNVSVSGTGLAKGSTVITKD